MKKVIGVAGILTLGTLCLAGSAFAGQLGRNLGPRRCRS